MTRAGDNDPTEGLIIDTNQNQDQDQDQDKKDEPLDKAKEDPPSDPSSLLPYQLGRTEFMLYAFGTKTTFRDVHGPWQSYVGVKVNY